MKKVIAPFLFSIIVLGYCTCCSGQRSISIPKEALVKLLMAEYHVPVVGVGIIQNGKLKQVKMFGNLPNHSPSPKNTLFNIASLTKPLTSTMVLRLISQGKWQLDEPLYHYWTDPEVANDERHKKLTTRHVLSHETGLPNWRGHEPGGKLSFAFEPGTQWKYSGEGFEYLRQALEHKFNTPFEKLVDSLVFKPLKMKNSRFYWDSAVDPSLFANAHHEDGSPYEMETWQDANPSNRVLTTVADYAKFGIGVMDGKDITPKLFHEMTTNQAHLENGKEWGLGWRLVKGLSNGEYAMVHAGSNPGTNTIIILLPKSKRGIVVFTNGAQGDQLYDKLIGESFDLGKKIVAKMK